MGVDAGSEFHSNLREARPFEAYFTTTSGVKSFGVFDTLSDGIQNLPMLPMQSIASDLYDLGGRKVQQTGKGIYIKDGRKYVVK